MARKDVGDILAGRLSARELGCQFADVAPLLDRQAALLAAQRCYYCVDAPCIEACPTGIDIPSFIRRIGTDNLRGAAMDILSANPLGGSCARVCPTEVLCEGACVRNHDDQRPVEIGALQRYATDWVFEQQARLFERGPDSGRRVAILGSGPAGLACAHGLARAGHRVTIFEPLAKSGGLNEYGIAAYKVPGFVPREIEWLMSVGGIVIEHGKGLGSGLRLETLRSEFDAVFLAIGLGGVNALKLEGEDLPGVRDAVDFIAELRQAKHIEALPVGRRVVVIGGGNTAIDAAVQSKKLGAESVVMVYRRGAESMGATAHEQEFAKSQGVHIIHWAKPRRFVAQNGLLAGVEFEYTQLDANGKVFGSGEHFVLAADQALKAIGQVMRQDGLDQDVQDADNGVALRDGRIAVGEDYATSLSGVWAGGDCVAGGSDLTVQAAEDGKRAAMAIDRFLAGETSHG